MALRFSYSLVVFLGLALGACTSDSNDPIDPGPGAADSGANSCGDGVCAQDESENSCPADCMDISTELCTDTCQYAGDGECDDGGPGADYDACELGTDCGDCGPRQSGGGGCDNATDGVCPAGCPLDPDCNSCTPDCTNRECGGDGCGGTCAPGCSSDQICEVSADSATCVGEGVNVGAACSACDDAIPGLRCLAPNQQEECGGTPFNGGNGWCNKGPLDSSGYCTKTCNTNEDCPSPYACLDANGGRFCLSS